MKDGFVTLEPGLHLAMRSMSSVAFVVRHVHLVSQGPSAGRLLHHGSPDLEPSLPAPLTGKPVTRGVGFEGRQPLSIQTDPCGSCRWGSSPRAETHGHSRRNAVLFAKRACCREPRLLWFVWTWVLVALASSWTVGPRRRGNQTLHLDHLRGLLSLEG
jgi:hypothetical protein